MLRLCSTLELEDPPRRLRTNCTDKSRCTSGPEKSPMPDPAFDLQQDLGIRRHSGHLAPACLLVLTFPADAVVMDARSTMEMKQNRFIGIHSILTNRTDREPHRLWLNLMLKCLSCLSCTGMSSMSCTGHDLGFYIP